MAWLSLDEADDEPERFFRYLIAAWDRAHPGILKGRLGVLLGSLMPDSEQVLSTFLNVATGQEERTVLILDDYHLISDQAIHEALTFLVDNLPPTLSSVLASRGEPPLPLARYHARGQMIELPPEELHFVQGETERFLAQSLGLELATGEVARLQEQTEGWIAGLQLAGLGLRRHVEEGQGSGERRVAVSGRQRFITDYLAQDVLGRQPQAVRDFLLRTSMLQRLCGALCEAVMEEEGARAGDAGAAGARESVCGSARR